jgi:hypothetical protein
MDVISFLCVSLGSSTVQLHDCLGSRRDVHIQRLVSVAKMVTVLEEYSTKDQSSVVRFFCGQKDSMQRLSIKMFPVYGGEVSVASRNSLKTLESHR